MQMLKLFSRFRSPVKIITKVKQKFYLRLALYQYQDALRVNPTAKHGQRYNCFPTSTPRSIDRYAKDLSRRVWGHVSPEHFQYYRPQDLAFSARNVLIKYVKYVLDHTPACKKLRSQTAYAEQF